MAVAEDESRSGLIHWSPHHRAAIPRLLWECRCCRLFHSEEGCFGLSASLRATFIFRGISPLVAIDAVAVLASIHGGLSF
jgi:hypothetical protein